MNKYVFDVDGTLTPSRQSIDLEFKEFFLEFIKKEKVYLVTGSDYAKTLEQLGSDICESVVAVYNCSGSQVRHKGKVLSTCDWTLPENARKWLNDELIRSPFYLRTGNHIEDRPGTCNFSIVGRNATPEQRRLYVEYDEVNKERVFIANTFNYVWGSETEGLQAMVGGDTGIDIYPIGKDKSQILSDFSKDDNIHFFGDKMETGGNDYPLAKANEGGVNHHVADWQETFKILKGLEESNNVYNRNGLG